MIEIITKAYSQIRYLIPIDLIQIASIAKVQSISKGELLINEGDLNRNVYLVIKGLLRHYTIDNNGSEITLLFVQEKMHTSIIETIFNEEPAKESIQALEDSVLIRFDFHRIEKITRNNPRLLRMQNQAFRETIFTNVEHIKSLTVLTPEERYSQFCSKNPHLEQRIKQKYLASYLGVTPTSLSRIRSRIVSQTLE